MQLKTRDALFIVDAFAAVTAVGGGIALVTGVENKRFPAEWLTDTPFHNYLGQGLILAGLVGGTATVAAVATLRSPRVGGLASLLAGAVLMGWIVGEILLLEQGAVNGTRTEHFFFAVGVLMMLLGWIVGRTAWRQ